MTKKNIQVIDGADNCHYPIYSMEEEYFGLIFPNGQDIEFIEDFWKREVKTEEQKIEWIKVFESTWENEVDKKNVSGIHGTLFYDAEFNEAIARKKKYYPTKKEEEAIVPLTDGTEIYYPKKKK